VTSLPATAAQYRDAYAAVHRRLVDLLSATDGSEQVPSCPGWTARDVLAHLVGLCDDWVHQRLDGYATTTWTADQVARYAMNTVPELLERWTQLAVVFARLEDHPALGPPARWAFGDAVIHEADLRGALDAGHVPHEAVLLSLEGTIIRWRDVLDNTRPSTTLIVRPIDAPAWTLGPPNNDPPVVVNPTAHELFRALAGRRTKEQVRAWSWSSKPDAILNAGLPYPFHWATAPITD
jgi:uncharacterized protein (TIGR03083 family)